ncbi:MAG TPA: 16S rRNA (cytosine(967)-C(5))-methyltransferase RsmB, partial [Blastocatellia bacterium]|nr:16S rRNA (cytosine(967)-C(5))-methyltransferase RsmB [Blastocatellia bacterium]
IFLMPKGPNRTGARVSPARRAAYDILRRVYSEGAYAAPLVAALAASDLSREDRALAQEIVMGVLRMQKSLDYFVERYSRRRLDRIDLPVLIAIRMGLYQIRHLTRIPQSAAVNESVNLVKRARHASAAPLVNAALRQAARNLDEQPGGTLDDPDERASVEVSHPRWMIERWVALLGREEAIALARANNRTPALAFRVNTLRASESEALASLEAEGVLIRASHLVPGAFVLEGGPSAAYIEAAEEGTIYIQDQASQLVSQLLDVKSDQRVLDLCAAPGSKTSHIAALAPNSTWIMACDIHPHRLAELVASCRRLGANSVDAVALDASREFPLDERAMKFDRVLVDAPCSGTGTLRRNPEIKWRLSPEDPRRLSDVQLELLARAAEAVADGGRLVYSTCSIEREENEDVITRFLSGGAAFRLIEPVAHPDLISGEGFVRTYPHRHDMDGFFAAVMEKT